jgi:hypothetical protein
MCVVAAPRAVDVISSHQFEEEIGIASSENGFFIAKMEFSVRTLARQILAADFGIVVIPFPECSYRKRFNSLRAA